MEQHIPYWLVMSIAVVSFFSAVTMTITMRSTWIVINSYRAEVHAAIREARSLIFCVASDTYKREQEGKQEDNNHVIDPVALALELATSIIARDGRLAVEDSRRWFNVFKFKK